ncbi:OLC1v1036346C2 [Oldenlandia corymbosa var. corymbosa]|uniref:OLC1v1036346C2 n=1 Tax=Oldenlandia corymbosa var. corymbosa TaxID=529605 RepID=A0AAV1CV31_OLDCO|nr:OLC1v1036346C2 [Oldenlandia corymbosa var. corymbosa]
MASRVAVQQNRAEGAVPEGRIKQKNMAAAPGGRNRRALGDIGNLVTARAVLEGKPLPQRPVTRSFCAQLLANAQAAKAAENNKKCLPVKVENEGVVGAQAKKPVQKKPVVKPKPEAVIEISSDSEPVKVDKREKKANGKKTAPTLSSTLSARSKAACGLSKKTKDVMVVDIDAADINNELAVTEYLDDLYQFYKIAENESRVGDYMPSQPDINEKMRAILIDWLIEVHHKFELNQETLYLTINIIDRYLAIKATPRKELQLLGMGAMLVASKYEEIWAPEVNDFVCMSDRAYTHAQVLSMEKRILGELQWTLTVPTPYVFLVRFIKASIPDSDIMENLVYFLAELGMMNYATISYSPSTIAASAVYAARCTLQKTPLWDDTLRLHTGLSEQQVLDCAKLLVSYHAMAPDHKLRVIYKKYSSTERGAVAALPPAKALLELSS